MFICGAVPWGYHAYPKPPGPGAVISSQWLMHESKNPPLVSFCHLSVLPTSSSICWRKLLLRLQWESSTGTCGGPAHVLCDLVGRAVDGAGEARGPVGVAVAITRRRLCSHNAAQLPRVVEGVHDEERHLDVRVHIGWSIAQSVSSHACDGSSTYVQTCSS